MRRLAFFNTAQHYQTLITCLDPWGWAIKVMFSARCHCCWNWRPPPRVTTRVCSSSAGTGFCSRGGSVWRFVQYCQNPKHTVSRALVDRSLSPESDNVKAIMTGLTLVIMFRRNTEEQEQARNQAIREAHPRTHGDLHLAGCGYYVQVW